VLLYSICSDKLNPAYNISVTQERKKKKAAAFEHAAVFCLSLFAAPRSVPDYPFRLYFE
jgi:hypothetical protein